MPTDPVDPEEPQMDIVIPKDTPTDDTPTKDQDNTPAPKPEEVPQEPVDPEDPQTDTVSPNDTPATPITPEVTVDEPESTTVVTNELTEETPQALLTTNVRQLKQAANRDQQALPQTGNSNHALLSLLLTLPLTFGLIFKKKTLK